MTMRASENPLSASQISRLREIVEAHCGIVLNENVAMTIERKLQGRIDVCGANNFESYLRLLEKSPREIGHAVDALATNETYFFRELYKLRSFQHEILPELHRRLDARGSTRLSIWSAGCSTGEEAYTIAMLIDETKLFDGWTVRILGNDISRSVIARARAGVYSDSAFRAMPPEYERYFERTHDGSRRVRRAIRDMCSFGQLNLVDREKTAVVGQMDAIFCRNVLIYFNRKVREKVVRTFFEHLDYGGYLLLGHSESLLQLDTEFENVHLPDDLVYRRPL